MTELVRKVALEKQSKLDLERQLEEKIKASINTEKPAPKVKKAKTVTSE